MVNSSSVICGVQSWQLNYFYVEYGFLIIPLWQKNVNEINNINILADVNFANSKSNMHPLYAGGSFVLAQEQDGKIGGGFFNKYQAYSGKLTQVEMWNTVLWKAEIEDLAKCKMSTIKPENRIVTWGSDAWTWHNTDPNIDSPLEDFCKPNTLLDTQIFASKLSFDKMAYLCEVAGGKTYLYIYIDSKCSSFIMIFFRSNSYCY